MDAMPNGGLLRKVVETPWSHRTSRPFCGEKKEASGVGGASGFAIGFPTP